MEIGVVAAMEGAGIEVPEGRLLAISMKRRKKERQDEEGQDGGGAVWAVQSEVQSHWETKEPFLHNINIFCCFIFHLYNMFII